MIYHHIPTVNIAQWGTATGYDGGAEHRYSYPIAFPNKVLGAASNKNSRSGWGSVDGNTAGIELVNNAVFNCYADDGTQSVNYIVVGF